MPAPAAGAAELCCRLTAWARRGLPRSPASARRGFVSRGRGTGGTSFPGARRPLLLTKFPSALSAPAAAGRKGGGRPGGRLLPLVMGSGLKGQRRVGSGEPGRDPARPLRRGVVVGKVAGGGGSQSPCGAGALPLGLSVLPLRVQPWRAVKCRRFVSLDFQLFGAWWNGSH